MVNSVCNIIVKGLVREKWSSSLRMWRQLVFPRSQTGWRPPSGETIARLQAGECRCLSVTPWRCGYIVCYCILCTRSTTTPAAIRPPSGRQRLRFPSPHHLTATLPFNTDIDHHHSFSMLSVLFERLEQCGTASATRSMDETLQGLENSARGEKLMPVRWSQFEIMISLILFHRSWSFELDHKSMWLGGF